MVVSGEQLVNGPPKGVFRGTFVPNFVSTLLYFTLLTGDSFGKL